MDDGQGEDRAGEDAEEKEIEERLSCRKRKRVSSPPHKGSKRRYCFRARREMSRGNGDGIGRDSDERVHVNQRPGLNTLLEEEGHWVRRSMEVEEEEEEDDEDDEEEEEDYLPSGEEEEEKEEEEEEEDYSNNEQDMQDTLKKAKTNMVFESEEEYKEESDSDEVLERLRVQLREFDNRNVGG
tara:strand:- start:7 stop:555 length:549 start_codon:yes stop_codon:yes gene_type:complete